MPNGENSGRYAGYDIPDFICDPFFQDWIIHPDGEQAAFWEDWITQNADKTEIIGQARLLLQSMYFKEHFPEEAMAQQSLAVVKEKIEQEKVVPMRRRTGRIWWAAAVVICITAGYFLTRHRYTERTYATRYAEIQTLYLPDSSKLILNAHSSVRYSREWQSGRTREVWLDGEAYFDVRQAAASTFLVHVKDLTVEVLGTAFDIRNRRGKTEIVLESGKIRVRFPAGSHDDVVMTPGNKIVYDPVRVTLARTGAVPENYTLWKDKKLTDATAREIIEYLEDNYNKTIILDDETLANKKIGGVILLDNFDDALFALSTVLNATVIQHQDTLILKPR